MLDVRFDKHPPAGPVARGLVQPQRVCLGVQDDALSAGGASLGVRQREQRRSDSTPPRSGAHGQPAELDGSPDVQHAAGAEHLFALHRNQVYAFGVASVELLVLRNPLLAAEDIVAQLERRGQLVLRPRTAYLI